MLFWKIVQLWLNTVPESAQLDSILSRTAFSFGSILSRTAPSWTQYCPGQGPAWLDTLSDSAQLDLALSRTTLSQWLLFSFFFNGVTAHGRRSVHHEDLVPNEYISKLAHFYRNWFTDLSLPMVEDFLETIYCIRYVTMVS